jgi:hypothetical protein
MRSPSQFQAGDFADWQIGRLADWQIGRLADWLGSHTVSGHISIHSLARSSRIPPKPYPRTTTVSSSPCADLYPHILMVLSSIACVSPHPAAIKCATTAASSLQSSSACFLEPPKKIAPCTAGVSGCRTEVRSGETSVSNQNPSNDSRGCEFATLGLAEPRSVVEETLIVRPLMR